MRKIIAKKTIIKIEKDPRGKQQHEAGARAFPCDG